MSIEAMKLALEALEDIFGKNKVDVGAITALRTAIEQAEKQEPVAWRTYDRMGYYVVSPSVAEAERDFPGKNHQSLYTTPQPQREWVGLTDEEIAQEVTFSKAHDSVDRFWGNFARAIEAKLKEKNR